MMRIVEMSVRFGIGPRACRLKRTRVMSELFGAQKKAAARTSDVA
jgi:hypothetical protein